MQHNFTHHSIPVPMASFNLLFSLIFLFFCSARLHVGAYFSLLDTGLLAVRGLTVFGTQDKYCSREQGCTWAGLWGDRISFALGLEDLHIKDLLINRGSLPKLVLLHLTKWIAITISWERYFCVLVYVCVGICLCALVVRGQLSDLGFSSADVAACVSFPCGQR